MVTCEQQPHPREGHQPSSEFLLLKKSLAQAPAFTCLAFLAGQVHSLHTMGRCSDRKTGNN